MDIPRQQHARTLLVIAAVVGITGDLLLRAVPWGLNAALWGLLLLAAPAAGARLFRERLPAGSTVLFVLGALCLACVALRDAETLTVWNILAGLLAAGLVAARLPSLRRLTVGSMLWTFLLHAAFSLAGMVLLLGEDLKAAPPTRHLLPWGAAARGILLSVPPLLLFGALLTSADAQFEYLVREVLDIDLWKIVSHLLLIAVLCWITGGVLRGRFIAGEIALPQGVRMGASTIGAVETGVLLGSLNLLFLAFVIVQLPYLFGGNTLVLQTPGLTYAGYARRGFFELVAVLTCALPLLLGTEWMLRKDRIPQVVLFRTLAGTMVALLLTILASAVQRLWLYASAYGLTESRVHAAAILLWLLFMLVWFVMTVLRGYRDRFLFGSAVAGYAVLLSLNALDPDALVTGVNLSRAASGAEIDVRHTVSLSADAVPVVLDRWASLSPEEQDRFARAYLARYDTTTADWRTFNRSRVRATELVHARRASLQGALIPAPEGATR